MNFWNKVRAGREEACRFKLWEEESWTPLLFYVHVKHMLVGVVFGVILGFSLALLLILLLGCIEEGSTATCHQLWVDCPGTLNDYIVSGNASGLQQEVRGDSRYFTYVHCEDRRRTPTLVVPAECSVGYRY